MVELSGFFRNKELGGRIFDVFLLCFFIMVIVIVSYVFFPSGVLSKDAFYAYMLSLLIITFWLYVWCVKINDYFLDLEGDVYG